MGIYRTQNATSPTTSPRVVKDRGKGGGNDFGEVYENLIGTMLKIQIFSFRKIPSTINKYFIKNEPKMQMKTLASKWLWL